MLRGVGYAAHGVGELDPDRYVGTGALQVDVCCACDQDIFEGEEYFDINGDIVCEECRLDYTEKFRVPGSRWIG